MTAAKLRAATSTLATAPVTFIDLDTGQKYAVLGHMIEYPAVQGDHRTPGELVLTGRLEKEKPCPAK